MNGRVLFLIITLVLALLGCGALFPTPHSTTYVYPDHFPGQTLQEAIWNEMVKDGDIIVVRQGTYHGGLVVNKSITLEGFDRHTTILDGDWRGTVINVTASYVSIFEFTIRNGSEYGVYVMRTAQNCNISRNIITKNYYGIWIYGSNLTLRDNDIKDNRYNFGVSEHYIHDIDDSNKVEGKPIRYWINRSSGSISYAGYVAVVNSKNVIVEDASLRKNVQGVLVVSSINITLRRLELRDNYIGIKLITTTNSMIENISVSGDYGINFEASNSNSVNRSTILHNGYSGIELLGSKNNIISDNVIKSTYIHYGIGIDLYESDNNFIVGNNITDNWNSVIPICNGSLFYHNNFINNHEGVMSIPTCANSWNLTREGNYWGDLMDVMGLDKDGDGINDPPFRKRINDYNIDYYTLNEPWKSTRKINATLWWIPRVPVQYFVLLHSNHVLASRRFIPNWEQGYGLITFNITASTEGLCSLDIPRARLDIPIELKIDGTLIDPKDYDLSVNVTHIILRFNYTEGRHMVEIKGYVLGFAIGDINGDGKVSMDDIIIVVQAFGKHYR